MKLLLRNGAAALLVLIVSSAFCQKGKYSIDGKFSGLPDGTRLEMVPAVTHKSEKPVAETEVKNGEFRFTGVVEGPRFFFIRPSGAGYSGFNVMVEKGNISVKGRAKPSLARNGDSTMEFQDVVVSGSKSHDQFLQKTSLRDSLDQLYNAYHDNNREVLNELDSARESKDSVRIKQVFNSAAYKKFADDESGFFKAMQKQYLDLILSHKDSWWGPFLMLHSFSYFTPREKELFMKFSDEAKNSHYGKIVKQDLYPPSFVGKAAPSLALVNETNQDVNFNTVASGKRYVILDFWASWCGPCRKQLPALKKFYEEMSNKGVEIISVSIDKKEADWKKALQEEELPWPNFLDTKNMADKWSVKAIPAMFLLDGKGMVLAEQVSLDEIIKKIGS